MKISLNNFPELFSYIAVTLNFIIFLNSPANSGEADTAEVSLTFFVSHIGNRNWKALAFRQLLEVPPNFRFTFKQMSRFHGESRSNLTHTSQVTNKNRKNCKKTFGVTV